MTTGRSSHHSAPGTETDAGQDASAGWELMSDAYTLPSSCLMSAFPHAFWSTMASGCPGGVYHLVDTKKLGQCEALGINLASSFADDPIGSSVQIGASSESALAPGNIRFPDQHSRVSSRPRAAVTQIANCCESTSALRASP